MAAKYSQEIVEALKFFEIADVPGTMKDLNKLYRKLSLKFRFSRVNRTVSRITDAL